MQDHYIKAVSDYAIRYEFPCSLSDDKTSAIMEVEGFPITITLQESIHSLIISCAIAPLPERNQARVYGELLQLHNAFFNTHYCVFGLDEEKNMLTLQRIVPFMEPDGEAFEKLMSDFLSAISQAFEDVFTSLLDWECNDPVPSDEGLNSMVHMLRV